MEAMKGMIVSSVIDEPTVVPRAAPPLHARAPTGSAGRNPTLAFIRPDSGARPASPTRHKGGLPPRALRRVRDYIDACLGESVDNATLAAVATLSGSHFVRAFKQSEGVTPHRYVIRRRVERVKELLAATEDRKSGV